MHMYKVYVLCSSTTYIAAWNTMFTIKATPVILVIEFSFPSLNDTVSGQWWWQLITLRCQQRFLGIWAAVLQSILACSSSGGKKNEHPRWEFCASVAIERWGNKLLNLSNHTLPEEFLKWGWSKTLKFEPLAHGPGFNIWWDSLMLGAEYKCLLITGPAIKSSHQCAFTWWNVNGIKISIHSSQFSGNKVSLKAGREENGLESTETAGL